MTPEAAQEHTYRDYGIQEGCNLRNEMKAGLRECLLQTELPRQGSQAQNTDTTLNGKRKSQAADKTKE